MPDNQMPDAAILNTAAWLSETNEVTRTFLNAGRIPGLINLGGGLPEPATYPVEALAELARRAVADHPAESLNYAPIEGLPALREAIARRYSTRSLKLGPENVLVTSGGMQALDMLGKLFIDQGDVLAAQSPTYLGALDAWRPRYPTYRPMTREQLGTPGLLAGARFAYTVPNFSNPTGALVDVKTRRALVADARATGTPLVEDDPYGALYYDGNALPRMIEMDAATTPSARADGLYDGPVIYLGTVSKELAPGLRTGWMIAAPEVISATVMVKQGSDLATSSLSQRVVASAMESGLMETVIGTILDTYRPRRDALCAALDEHLSAEFTWTRPVGGMFVWITAKDPAMDTNRLMEAGLEHGVCISPSSVFDTGGRNRSGARLNFTANGPEKLAEAVRRLATAVATIKG